MTTAAEYQTKVTKSVTNMDRFDQIVNGDATTTVTTDNGDVPSLSKVISETGWTAEAITVATGKAEIATEQAELSTEKATLSGSYADIAAAAALGTAGALAAAPRQGGRGVNISADGGSVTILLAPARTRALTFAVENADGTLGTILGSFDSALGKANFAILSVSAGFDTDRALVRSLESKSSRLAVDSPAIFGPDSNTRMAWGTKDFFWDGVDKVLRAPGLVAAGDLVPDGALTRRGPMIGLQRWTRPTQYGAGSARPIVATAALRKPANKRTHATAAFLCKSDRYFYAMSETQNGVLGDATFSPEGAGCHLTIWRRPVSGGAWTEFAQFVPSNGTGKLTVASIAMMPSGRIAVFSSFLPYGGDDYTYGTWVSFLSNPDMPSGGVPVWTDPVFLCHGVSQPGSIVDGEYQFPAYVPWLWPAWYARGDYDKLGKYSVSKGSRHYRLVETGPGAPYAEAMMLLPALPDLARETYTEDAVIRLNRGLGATADWYTTHRTLDGIQESFGTIGSDGRVTWTTPVDARIKTGTGAPVRTRMIRTQMGNIAYLGNQDPANRYNMGLRFSTDECATFGARTVVLEDLSSTDHVQTSYGDVISWIDPATGRSKLATVYDRGRGRGSGVPADIYFNEFFEDELLDGTVTTAAALAAREKVWGLEYVP